MAFLGSLAIYHIVRMLGAAGKYVVLPAQRPRSLDKLKRSLVCLQWVSQPQRSPLEMGIGHAPAAVRRWRERCVHRRVRNT